MDVININTLVVTLYYSFARCYNWEKLGKGSMGISIISYNCMHIYNDLNPNFNFKILLQHRKFMLQNSSDYFSKNKTHTKKNRKEEAGEMREREIK